MNNKLFRNKNELATIVYSIWFNYLKDNKIIRSENNLLKSIKQNLLTLDGVDKELEYISIELQIMTKDNIYYDYFLELCEELNIYKTYIERI